jgi:hypothetical protein
MLRRKKHRGRRETRKALRKPKCVGKEYEQLNKKIRKNIMKNDKESRVPIAFENLNAIINLRRAVSLMWGLDEAV